MPRPNDSAKSQIINLFEGWGAEAEGLFKIYLEIAATVLCHMVSSENIRHITTVHF